MCDWDKSNNKAPFEYLYRKENSTLCAELAHTTNSLNIRMEETKEFKHAVRVVLKRQMRNLLNQLEEAGEEVAVLTVNVEDRTCYQLASQAGVGFLTEQQQLSNNFLSYCENIKKKSGIRSLLEPIRPDEFSITQEGPRRSARQVQGKLDTTSSSDKAVKRASQVTDGPGVKKPRQKPPSTTVATRSGRKISTRYFESLQLLSKKHKKQIKQDPGSKKDVHEEESEETQTSGQCSENEPESPVHDVNIGGDDDSNNELPSNDDMGDNSVDADPDFKPAVRVRSKAVPAPLKTIEEKIKKIKRVNKKRIKSLVEITPYECEHCGVYIKGKTSLSTHIRRVHLKEKNHTCKVCGYSFYSSTSMENHKLSVHTRPCAQCGQYVIEVEPWAEGVNNRTRRRVLCTCGAEVAIFSAYGRAGKPEDAEDKDDSQNNEEDSQDAKDARYACGTCGKLFLKKYLCVQHSRRHSFAMPHVCDLCGRSFRYTGSLKGHLEKEHGVMRLICDLCGKNYSNESSLKVHMSKTHMKYAKHVGEPGSESGDVSESVNTITEVVQDILESGGTQTESVQLIVTEQSALPNVF